MANIEIKDFSFTYPGVDHKALDNISLTVYTSEFVVLCGKSGCGKSTLLRQLKKNLIPYGKYEGETLYDGMEIAELDDRINASEIGFVQQNPDNQLVTDKVWHELAFGLESLGLDNQSIKRRVAEMASYFDIQTWFRKSVSELSGGQKQLLNLASIMVMQPKVLILDEPTSQLDPIAASDFLRTIYKINRDLGTTVIISEHRLEELFPMADRVIVMEEGKISAFDQPWQIGKFLAGVKEEGVVPSEEDKHPMFYGLPAVMKIYADVKPEGYIPMTIRDGRLWLESLLGEPKTPDIVAVEGKHGKKLAEALKGQSPTSEESTGTRPVGVLGIHNDDAIEKITEEEVAIGIKDLWFRYDKNSGDVLRGLNLSVRRGELLCVLGGNGVGKSTTMKTICGILTPQRGTIKINGVDMKKMSSKELFTHNIAMLPQNPQSLFTEITVEEELLEALYYIKMSDYDKAQHIEDMLDLMEIKDLRKAHPYDLSGGEQQRLALGKILLVEPQILLLDEPTKGLDPFFKMTFAGILRKLKAKGVTIFLVSHDVEFCAEYADRCAMFFDGDIVSIGTPKKFFAGNSFYTTVSNRVARQWFKDAITYEEVAECVKATM